MEHPCLECKTPTLCRGSRNILAKSRNPASLGPEPGPCEPFNEYVQHLRSNR